MSKKIIGIDPGENGGIAIMTDDGVATAMKMPATMADIYHSLSDVLHSAPEGCEVVCYLEKVGFGMPGQSSKATAKFARHNGHLEMALFALGIKTNEVTPQKWIKHYQLGKSSDHSKTEWKNMLKSKCQQLFPKMKVTLSVCDALLIAEYGRIKEVGK